MPKHFRKLTLPFSDPDEIEDEIYADDFDDENTEPCGHSPSGHCEYTAADNFKLCKWCKQESGLP